MKWISFIIFLNSIKVWKDNYFTFYHKFILLIMATQFFLNSSFNNILNYKHKY